MQIFTEGTSEVIGYLALIKMFNITALPHFCESRVSSANSLIHSYKINDIILTTYPKSYVRNFNDPLEQLEFALKYEGINLLILTKVFKKLDKKLLVSFINQYPTGKYTRKLWFLYEFLLEELLDIADCKFGPYYELLDEKMYYTALNKPSKRHRIYNNLLGNVNFCPMVRKTEALDKFVEAKLDKVAANLVDKYDPDILSRAAYYLYTKETISSIEIEREQPNLARVEKYIKIITEIAAQGNLNQETLIILQNAIVDPRFCDNEYRVTQNYVGEVIRNFQPKIHFISPKPEDVHLLMYGLLDCLTGLLEQCSKNGNLHPVVISAVISFGFIYIHPFEDGNGRLHRYLIHYILLHTKFTADDLIFPISATILADRKSYDSALEKFSIPLLQTIKQYTLTSDGNLIVNEDTKNLYQYIDYTALVEYLFLCVEKTINSSFKDELDYIVLYDKLKKSVRNIVDLPQSKLDLMINLILSNNGKLSDNKRKKYFSMLTDGEILEIEKLYKDP